MEKNEIRHKKIYSKIIFFKLIMAKLRFFLFRLGSFVDLMREKLKKLIPMIIKKFNISFFTKKKSNNSITKN